MIRDYQRAKVYAWENAFFSRFPQRPLKIEAAQGFVDGVFLALGLLYPPKVLPLSPTSTTKSAKANRLDLYMRPVLPRWIILHELAHSLTDDAHGPNFMGIYLKLLDKVLNLPLPLLEYSLKGAKVDYNLAARPLDYH